MTAVHATLIVVAVSTGILMAILAFFQRALKETSSPPESALMKQRFFGVAHDRYFRLNLVRGIGLGVAFILFLGREEMQR
jgi:hypothetical protein